jgi:hypothetical protein
MRTLLPSGLQQHPPMPITVARKEDRPTVGGTFGSMIRLVVCQRLLEVLVIFCNSAMTVTHTYPSLASWSIIPRSELAQADFHMAVRRARNGDTKLFGTPLRLKRSSGRAIPGFRGRMPDRERRVIDRWLSVPGRHSPWFRRTSVCTVYRVPVPAGRTVFPSQISG